MLLISVGGDILPSVNGVGFLCIFPAHFVKSHSLYIGGSHFLRIFMSLSTGMELAMRELGSHARLAVPTPYLRFA